TQYYKKISNREMASIFVMSKTEDGNTVYLNFISKVDENLGILVTMIIDQTEEMMLLKRIEHQQSLSFIVQNIASIAHEIRNAMILFEYDENLEYKINGDHNRLIQMIINLLKNAIEAMDTNNYIVVRLLYRGKNTLQLSVQDSGKGMNAVDIENALNPFYTTK